MRRIPIHSRRRFLSRIGAASIAGWAATSTSAEPSDTTPKASDYLLPSGVIHLNTASLGATPRVVLERTLEAWRELESDPVAMTYYQTPQTVLSAAERVRERAASFLGCDADEVLITRCTTDAMNTVAQGIRFAAGDRILTTDQEHHGGSMCWAYQAQRHGAAIDRVPIAFDEYDSPAIVQRFAKAITPATRVISVSHVITSTGLRMPVEDIAAMARERGILCVIDGAQAVGAIPVNVKALGCHAYATSGHKWLMGPKGTGLLYVSRDAGAAIQPIQWQDGHRYGAESAGVGPLPLAIGLGTAIQRMQDIGMTEVERHGRELRNRAYAGLQQLGKVRLVGPPPGPRASAMVSCALPEGIDSKALRDTLRDKHGIIVKMIEKRWFNGIRLSPHVLNTTADIDATLRALRVELG
jgi:selenocysteine lyase/cysteine desulfurase